MMETAKNAPREAVAPVHVKLTLPLESDTQTATALGKGILTTSSRNNSEDLHAGSPNTSPQYWAYRHKFNSSYYSFIISHKDNMSINS